MIKATKNHYYIGITIALILLIAIVGIFSMIGINEPTKTAYALSGNGTEENPYLIDTKADLEDFRDAVNNNGERTACALLTSNIDLGDDQWTPIGTETSKSYNGTFDGAGHTVTLNMVISVGLRVVAKVQSKTVIIREQSLLLERKHRIQ